MEAFLVIVSLLLTGFVITDVSAAFLLLSKAVQSNYSLLALNERAGVAVIQATSGTLLGILGANRIFDWDLPETLVLLILTTAVLIQALPSIIWLYLYFAHKFEARG